jgi:hypothetical protein
MTSMDMDALDEMRLLAKKTAALARAAESLPEATALCSTELELSLNTSDRQEA